MAQNVRSARRAAAARKVKRTLSSAQVHIFASFNNTIITVTDAMGAPVCWGSSGAVGYKGSRKSTPFAARLAAEQAIKTAQTMGIQEVLHLRHHSGSAQWLPPAQETPRVIEERNNNGKIYWSGLSIVPA